MAKKRRKINKGRAPVPPPGGRWMDKKKARNKRKARGRVDPDAP